MQRANRELAKLCARGVTIVAASGDAGSNDDNCTQHAATFPQSSPYVLVVGATVGGPNGTEIPVSIAPVSEQYWTTGAGFSDALPRPWYQEEFVGAYVAEMNASRAASVPRRGDYNADGRAYPDVTGIGQNVMSTYDGAVLPMGLGTSASAPLYAAILSRLNNELMAKGGSPVGLVNPLLYKAKAELGSKCWRDMFFVGLTTAEGCPRGFPSSRGRYDAVVGVGALANFSSLLTFALRHQRAQPSIV